MAIGDQSVPMFQGEDTHQIQLHGFLIGVN